MSLHTTPDNPVLRRLSQVSLNYKTTQKNETSVGVSISMVRPIYVLEINKQVNIKFTGELGCCHIFPPKTAPTLTFSSCLLPIYARDFGIYLPTHE